jgi:glycine hydroxymethyltransferase
LKQARLILEACGTFEEMAKTVSNVVNDNRKWRGENCINLLAPEAPTSPGVRALLSSEIGTRAAEGHIGPNNRWFAGTRYIDEVESLCVELLKKLFKCNYAEHRLCASMIGNAVVYTALTRPGDSIMSIAQPYGGHSSNRLDGPAGSRGLSMIDIPMDPDDLVVDLDAFRRIALRVRPKLIALGLSMVLFPFPIRQMQDIVKEWDGKIFFDGAHQLGLVAGGQYQDPLSEGALIMTGSAGKTFSGPQSGIMVWNDPAITESITHAVFPIWAATHQVNRVAALAYAAAEMLAFGEPYMAQIVENAQNLGEALYTRGIPVLGAHKQFTRTHQIILDVSRLGGGLKVARLLEQANIITNKNLIPCDRAKDWNHPSGIRIGTTEVTRLGMKKAEMKKIADLIAEVVLQRINPEKVRPKSIELRRSFQKIHYCFD